MHRETFEAALRSTVPESAMLTGISLRTNERRPTAGNGNGQIEKYKVPIESGTTVLAFHFKEGIIMAGDRQMSNWFSIISQDILKIEKIGLYSGFMFAGMVSDGQEVVNSLRRTERDFLERFGVPLSLDGQANFVSRLMRTYYNYGIFLEAWGIVAGLNFNPPSFSIYSIEPTGSKMVIDEFTTTGSGMEKVESELERFRGRIASRSLEQPEAMGLAVRAIYMAGKKDMGTSDVRLAVPTIATITLKEGFRFIGQAQIKETVDKLIEEERRSSNVA